MVGVLLLFLATTRKEISPHASVAMLSASSQLTVMHPAHHGLEPLKLRPETNPSCSEFFSQVFVTALESLINAYVCFKEVHLIWWLNTVYMCTLVVLEARN